MKFNVGQVVYVKEFAFVNKSGGTGMSQGFEEFGDPTFRGNARVRVTKEWEDYECGQRGWAVAMGEDVKQYLKDNANPKDQRIFISEFDVVKVERF
jgi:hypothetical protein